MRSKNVLLVFAAAVASVGFSGDLTAKIAAKCPVTGTDEWYGCRRTVFRFDGHEAWVVEPPVGVKVAEGSPWTWTMQWATAYVPRTSVPRLVKERGWRHATVITYKEKMDPHGLEVSARFQKYLVEGLGFAKKAHLIGMSWGGFFSTRYAAAHPENVAKIYYDAPLMNFAGFASPTEDRIGPWAKLGVTDWNADPRMPVNLAEPIAKAGIPVLILYGGQDTVVNPALNCERFILRFKAAGGKITVDKRGLFGHHPHGVDPDKTGAIVNFFKP